jgi:hypothetical protein
MYQPNQQMAANQTRQLPQDQIPLYKEGPNPDGLVAAPVSLTKQFWVSYTSKLDGKTYEGQFTTKKMSVKDLGRVGVRKSQLNGGYYYDPKNPGVGIDAETGFLHSMIAQMEVCIIQAPMWYNLDLIIDTDLMIAIAQNVMEFEGSFFRSAGEQAVDTSSGENVGSAQGQESGTVGRVTPLVRGQVSATLDP